MKCFHSLISSKVNIAYLHNLVQYNQHIERPRDPPPKLNMILKLVEGPHFLKMISKRFQGPHFLKYDLKVGPGTTFS